MWSQFIDYNTHDLKFVILSQNLNTFYCKCLQLSNLDFFQHNYFIFIIVHNKLI